MDAEQRMSEEGGGAGRSRTDLLGFAIRCITALLPRPGAVFARRLGILAKKGSVSFPSWLSKSGAGDEARTRDLNLGKVALYQLSYSRVAIDVWQLPLLQNLSCKKKDHCNSPKL